MTGDMKKKCKISDKKFWRRGIVMAFFEWAEDLKILMKAFIIQVDKMTLSEDASQFLSLANPVLIQQVHKQNSMVTNMEIELNNMVVHLQMLTWLLPL